MQHYLVPNSPQASPHTCALEEYLGGDRAIAVNTVQLAIQMCVELLGSRTHLIPVALPVNAPPDTLAAVLRAGAQPILLDIDPKTLQMDPEKLHLALEELEAAAVILTRPGGQPVTEALLELVVDQPTILDSRLLPKKDLDPEVDLCGTFNVFDLMSSCGSGAVIIHKYQSQQKMLRMLRSGLMGHSGELSYRHTSATLDHLKNPDHMKRYKETVAELQLQLYNYTLQGITPWASSPTSPTPLLVTVPNNAQRTLTQLRSYDVEAVLASYPLHLLSEVGNRFKETPEYPNAVAAMSQVIAIPAHGIGKMDAQKMAIIIGAVGRD